MAVGPIVIPEGTLCAVATVLPVSALLFPAAPTQAAPQQTFA